MHEDLVDFKV